jgi:hypothetical protein
MALIPAVITNGWRSKLAQMFPIGSATLVSASAAATFKVGMGGWIDPGSGPVPRTPDPSFTDLDIVLDAARLPINRRYPFPGPGISSFSKSLIVTDFVFEPPNIMRINTLLDFIDWNDDGSGSSPQFWEIGIYDGTGLLMAYGTFPKEIKTNIKQLENVVRISF